MAGWLPSLSSCETSCENIQHNGPEVTPSLGDGLAYFPCRGQRHRSSAPALYSLHRSYGPSYARTRSTLLFLPVGRGFRRQLHAGWQHHLTGNISTSLHQHLIKGSDGLTMSCATARFLSTATAFFFLALTQCADDRTPDCRIVDSSVSNSNRLAYSA